MTPGLLPDHVLPVPLTPAVWRARRRAVAAVRFAAERARIWGD